MTNTINMDNVLTEISGNGWLPLACLGVFSPALAAAQVHQYPIGFSSFKAITREAIEAAFSHGLTNLTDHSETVNGYGIAVPNTQFTLWIYQDGSGVDTYAVRHPELGEARM